MRIDRAFLLLNMLLILVSVAAHEVASGAYVFLVLTVGLCAAVWWMEYGGRPPHMSHRLATFIAGAAFVVMMSRAFVSGADERLALLDIRVPAVGQFLIMVQWIYLLRRKREQAYGWIYLITVAHMGTAGLLMPGLGYAFFFLLYAAAGVCALSAYSMWRELRRAEGAARIGQVRLTWRFVLASVPAALVLMIPTSAVFMALPREATPGPLRARVVHLSVAMQPVVGFSQTVELGEIGEIQDNPQRVMNVKVFDPGTGEPLHPPELLLRGTALVTYEPEGDLWVWKEPTRKPHDPSHWVQLASHGGNNVRPIYVDSFPGFETGDYGRIRCDIALEPLQTQILFVPFAAETVRLPSRRRLWGHRQMHAIAFSERNRTQIEYTTTSRIFTPEPPSGEATHYPIMEWALRDYLKLHRALSPRVSELARRIAPGEECPDDYSKAARILSYLSDSSRFSYTLNQAPTPGVEPVEDFLFNRRRGHCEYFASAMAVMLRSVGVPARVVNGFKVTEWNPIGGFYIVRQSDAHSWVEAYLRPDGWRTFDPSVLREDATPKPMFVRRWWRNLYTTVETVWVRNVLNYSAEHQSGLYNAMRAALQPLYRMWRGTVALVGWALFQLNLLLGYGTGPVALLKRALAILIPLAVVVLALFGYRHLRSLPRAPRASGAAIRFYGRMERFLARRGFHRKAAQTAWEFRDELASKGWQAMEAVATITRNFCSARYGARVPSDEETAEIARSLRVIRSARFRPRR